VVNGTPEKTGVDQKKKHGLQKRQATSPFVAAKLKSTIWRRKALGTADRGTHARLMVRRLKAKKRASSKNTRGRNTALENPVAGGDSSETERNHQSRRRTRGVPTRHKGRQVLDRDLGKKKKDLKPSKNKRGSWWESGKDERGR